MKSNKFLNKNETTKKKETEIIINEKNFPYLSKITNETNNKEQILDYKMASLKEEIIDEKEEKIPGWTYLSYDKINSKVIIDPDNKIINNEEFEFDSQNDYNYYVNNVLDEMIDRWEKYKFFYIELYGEETYFNMYEIPNNENKYDDNNNDLDDENNNDENNSDEYDYYSDYSY